jgi:hypothetical protein
MLENEEFTGGDRGKEKAKEMRDNEGGGGNADIKQFYFYVFSMLPSF